MSKNLNFNAMPAWMKTGDYRSSLVAFGYADVAHANQQRKYTGEPYIFHCLDVANRLHDLYSRHGHQVPDNMVAAAALHDTVEDCGVSFQSLTEVFGKDISGLVFWLTDVCPKDWGNRAERKRLEAERIVYAPLEAKIIKWCDIMSNTESIEQHDPKFAKTYVPEKERVLRAIGTIGSGMIGDTLAFPYEAIE